MTGVFAASDGRVVYNWVELEGDPELRPMTGRIEIKDKMWKSGEYAFEACGSCAAPIEDFEAPVSFAFAPGMQSPLQLTSVNNAIPCKEKFSSDDCVSFFGVDPDELILERTPLGLIGNLIFGDLLSRDIYGAKSG